MWEISTNTHKFLIYLQQDDGNNLIIITNKQPHIQTISHYTCSHRSKQLHNHYTCTVDTDPN